MTIANWPSNLSNRNLLSSLSLEQALEQDCDFGAAEQQFVQLLTAENLDQQVLAQPEITQTFEAALKQALTAAYGSETSGNRLAGQAHLFLQRVLYRINRLNFFWYQDLNQYNNERSTYLQWVRDQIETPWQAWETNQMDLAHIKALNVEQALIERAEQDLEPPLSDSKRYIRGEMTLAGYRHLIAIASLDGLVESSRLCHILGGASNEVQATLIRVLLEEYGNGRLNRKHSTFFAQMMEELGLNSQPEAYFDLAPWEVLASINHNFLLTQRKRFFLRYVGGFTFFEIYGPSVYKDYMAVASRLGLSDQAMGYWELHIREDERHGQWMLHQAALPLAAQYPEQAWELVLGYDQDKYMGDRAGAAVMQAVQAAEAATGAG